MRTITITKKEDFNNFEGRQYYFDGGNLFVGTLVYDPALEEYQLRNARKSNKSIQKINSYRASNGDTLHNN